MQYVTKLLFEILPLEFYFMGGIIMPILVLPAVLKAAVREKEYKRVAFLMLILASTMFISCLVALTFLYCTIFGCAKAEEPFRGIVRLLISMNFVCGPLSLTILYHPELVKGSRK